MEASDEYEPFYFLYFSDKWFHSPYCQSVRPIEVAAAVEDPILDISDHNANESFEIANESVDIASYHASYLEKNSWFVFLWLFIYDKHFTKKFILLSITLRMGFDFFPAFIESPFFHGG